MKKTLSCSLLIVCTLAVGRAVADGPTMDQVVAKPASYEGRTLAFTGATLSGSITTYEVNYIRKYYLEVQGKDNKFEVGFFLAPPGLADKLADYMNRSRNYSVNLTCKVERIRINTFAQWHGIVTRVDFVDSDGKVVKTLKQEK
jgi:hypothetical protein